MLLRDDARRHVEEKEQKEEEKDEEKEEDVDSDDAPIGHQF